MRTHPAGARGGQEVKSGGPSRGGSTSKKSTVGPFEVLTAAAGGPAGAGGPCRADAGSPDGVSTQTHAVLRRRRRRDIWFPEDKTL